MLSFCVISFWGYFSIGTRPDGGEKHISKTETIDRMTSKNSNLIIW